MFTRCLGNTFVERGSRVYDGACVARLFRRELTLLKR